MLFRAGPVVLASLAVAAAAAPARADNYPDKPIRLILTSPPGGTSDALGRPTAQKLGESLGKQIVIDHRAGASGNIGAEIVAKSNPDGYTLLLAQTQTLAINPTLYKKLGFDPLRDFTPVAMVASIVFVLVANPSLAANTVTELVRLAKAQPGQLTFASASSGSVSHLAGELLKSSAGIDMLHVPYKGAGPAVIDLIGGQVMLMFAGGPSASTQIKAGRLKPIAVAGIARSPAFPGVPTIAEAGMPGFDVRAWWGVVAPAKTPQTVVARLNREIIRTLDLPDIREWFASQGADPVIMTPAQFGAYIKSEYTKWAKVVKDSGARVE